MLFFAERPETLEAMRNDYKDFVDAYESAAQHLVEAAARGYRLDPRQHFPDGSFAVIEEILSTARGFNPEAEFPRRSFPRPWPFVGGQLVPPPPDPPNRHLVFAAIDGKETIVWRGEIPSVHLPRRLDLDPPNPSFQRTAFGGPLNSVITARSTLHGALYGALHGALLKGEGFCRPEFFGNVPE